MEPEIGLEILGDLTNQSLKSKAIDKRKERKNRGRRSDCREARPSSAMTLSLSTSFLSIPAAARTTARTLRSVVPSQGMRCSMRKKGLHPEIYEDAKVYCNGELVLVTGGTKPEYTVDVWSGNHPYYVGDTSALVVMDSQIEKFRKKWGHIKEYWPEDQWREMHPDGDPEFEPEGDN